MISIVGYCFRCKLKYASVAKEVFLFFRFRGFRMPKCRSPPFLREKQLVKRNGGLQNEKRILSICRRTKSHSQWGYIQSLLTGKRTWKVFRAGEKLLAHFSSLDQDGHFADNIIDESVDVEKIVETQMMIETLRNAISQETTSSLSIKLILRSTKIKSRISLN